MYKPQFKTIAHYTSDSVRSENTKRTIYVIVLLCTFLRRYDKFDKKFHRSIEKQKKKHFLVTLHKYVRSSDPTNIFESPIEVLVIKANI